MCVHPNQDGAVLGVQDPPSFVATLLACAQDGGLQTVVSNLLVTPVSSPIYVWTEQAFVYFITKLLWKVQGSESWVPLTLAAVI